MVAMMRGRRARMEARTMRRTRVGSPGQKRWWHSIRMLRGSRMNLESILAGLRVTLQLGCGSASRRAVHGLRLSRAALLASLVMAVVSCDDPMRSRIGDSRQILDYAFTAAQSLGARIDVGGDIAECLGNDLPWDRIVLFEPDRTSAEFASAGLGDQAEFLAAMSSRGGADAHLVVMDRQSSILVWLPVSWKKSGDSEECSVVVVVRR